MLHHIFQKLLLPAALAGTMLAGTAAPAVSLAAQAATQPDSYHDDWLHVNDNAEIVDKDGNPLLNLLGSILSYRFYRFHL